MVDAIRSHQWRQGCVIPASLHSKLQAHAPRSLSESDCCIVLSQSCDVVHQDLVVEPIVELVLAKRLTGVLDGTFTYAKNARRIHFMVETNKVPTGHEALARERFSIPRHYLAEQPPDTTRSLDAAELRSLLAWIMSRYGRHAFPDAFNKRTGPTSERKIKPILKKLPKLKSLYVTLSSWHELADGKAYRIYLVGTLQTEDFKDLATRTSAEKSLLEIAAALNRCEGITVINAEVLSEATVTLDQLRNLVRWNLDFISLQDADNQVFAGLDL